MRTDQHGLIRLYGMYRLRLKGIKLKLILLGIIGAMIFLPNIIFGIKDLMNASFLISLHDNFYIFGFYFIEVAVALLLLDGLEVYLVLEERHGVGYGQVFVMVDFFVKGLLFLHWLLKAFWGIEDGEWVVLHFY
jgi:hypothetical protein